MADAALARPPTAAKQAPASSRQIQHLYFAPFHACASKLPRLHNPCNTYTPQTSLVHDGVQLHGMMGWSERDNSSAGSEVLNAAPSASAFRHFPRRTSTDSPSSSHNGSDHSATMAQLPPRPTRRPPPVSPACPPTPPTTTGHAHKDFCDSGDVGSMQSSCTLQLSSEECVSDSPIECQTTATLSVSTPRCTSARPIPGQRARFIEKFVTYARHDTGAALTLTVPLLRSEGEQAACDLASALLPEASAHPDSTAELIQNLLASPVAAQHRIACVQALLMHAPPCALGLLKKQHKGFAPLQALAALARGSTSTDLALRMVSVLHHAVAAGVPVAASLDVQPVAALCERAGVTEPMHNLLVALWRQDQHESDAAHACLSRMQCPDITDASMRVEEAQLARIAVPGTEVQQVSTVVPTREAPFFARQHFTFPAAPLSDVAPAASQVSSSTLGTGLYGVVVRSKLHGKHFALKVPYRTAEGSWGLRAELEAHMHVWRMLAEHGHEPSTYLCLARFVVFSTQTIQGRSQHLVEGLAMPCMDGTLWDLWRGGVAGWGLGSQGPYVQSMPLPAVAHMAATLAEGLASLHSAGCVHNDLHPQNVGVTVGSRARGGGRAAACCHVLDLGHAVQTGTAATRFERGGRFWPVWHAPESICGRGAGAGSCALRAAVDVWSFGCVLVTMLLGGTPPFAEVEAWGESDWQALAGGALWRAALSTLPEDELRLKELAQSCLNMDEAARPCMRDVHAVLKRAIEGQRL
eukprot:jgi/Ulvmu1/1772/UM118_0011.1